MMMANNKKIRIDQQDTGYRTSTTIKGWGLRQPSGGSQSRIIPSSSCGFNAIHGPIFVNNPSFNNGPWLTMKKHCYWPVLSTFINYPVITIVETFQKKMDIMVQGQPCRKQMRWLGMPKVCPHGHGSVWLTGIYWETVLIQQDVTGICLIHQSCLKSLMYISGLFRYTNINQRLSIETSDQLAQKRKLITIYYIYTQF